MFTRLLCSARTILTRASSAPESQTVTSTGPREETAAATGTDGRAMVTTRRGVDTNSPQVHDAPAKTGVKRRSDTADTPTGTAKRRRASLESLPQHHAWGSPASDHGVNGQVDHAKTTVDNGSKPAPAKTRTRSSQGGRRSPEVVIDTAAQQEEQQSEDEVQHSPQPTSKLDSDSVYATPATQGAASVYATPATHLKARSAMSTARAARPRPATLLEDHAPESKSEGSEIVLTSRARPNSTSPTGKAEASESTKKSKKSPARGSDTHSLLDPTAPDFAVESGDAIGPPAMMGSIPSDTAAVDSPKDDEATPRAPQSTASAPDASARKKTFKRAPAPPTSTSHHTTTPPKPTRIRFTSEEPPSVVDTLLTVLKSPEVPSSTAASEPQDAEDSDDEAPETITRDTALESARAADSDAAKAIAQQENTARRKRQERAARLAEQAKASRKSGKRKLDADADADADAAAPAALAPAHPHAASSQPQQHPHFDLQNLPALLPASLLASAPTARPPTPPPALPLQARQQQQQQRKPQNRHLRFPDAAARPPKDVRRGPVSVRVLEEASALLAPRRDRGSMGVRERWLMGRRGGGQAAGASAARVERRVVGGGFLRK